MSASEIVSIIEAKLSEKNISKGDFYKACRVTASQMSNWRRNKNYPLLDTLMRINNLLGTDFRLETKKPASVSADGVKINPHYFDLSEEDRAVVDAMIERLSKAGQ